MTESYYATLNAVYGPRSRRYHPVISKDGELLTPTDKINIILYYYIILWKTSLESFPTCPITHLLDHTDNPIGLLFQKDDRNQRGNYRCISLFSAVGKAFADAILQRLHLLAESLYPQSRSGYCHGMSTIDGIFTLYQLIEKTREQRRCLYIAFVDFVKAFDTLLRAPLDNLWQT